MSTLYELTRIAPSQTASHTTLTLPFEARQKSRLRTRLDNGAEAALYLERGHILRHGDCLQSPDGFVVEVRAAAESVSTVHSEDAILLARACYHLGNRHVPLQIGPGWVRYQHDHVLDDMVRGLGLEVICEQTSFEPEAGAYQGGQSHHHHDHD